MKRQQVAILLAEFQAMPVSSQTDIILLLAAGNTAIFPVDCVACSPVESYLELVVPFLGYSGDRDGVIKFLNEIEK